MSTGGKRFSYSCAGVPSAFSFPTGDNQRGIRTRAIISGVINGPAITRSHSCTSSFQSSYSNRSRKSESGGCSSSVRKNDGELYSIVRSFLGSTVSLQHGKRCTPIGANRIQHGIEGSGIRQQQIREDKIEHEHSNI